MNRFAMTMLALVLAFAFMLPTSQVARAEELTCRGKLGGITVDNLVVPSNGTCTLNGTRIQGTLKVESNATLKATRINVNGNIQAENAKAVNVASSVVGGSIQIKEWELNNLSI